MCIYCYPFKDYLDVRHNTKLAEWVSGYFVLYIDELSPKHVYFWIAILKSVDFKRMQAGTTATVPPGDYKVVHRSM